MILLRKFNFIDDLKLLLSIVFLLFALLFVYYDVSVLYKYQHIFPFELDSSKIYLIFLILILFYVPVRKLYFCNKFSSDVIFCLFVLSFIPFMVLIITNEYSLFFVFIFCLYWFSLFLFEIFIPDIKIDSVFFNKVVTKLRTLLLFLLIITVLYVWYSFTNFRLQFDIINVYAARAEARGYNVIFPFSYLLVFSDNFLPIFSFYYLSRKKYIIFILLSVVIFLNFSISGTKQIFFLYFIGVFSLLFISILKKYKFKDVFLFSIGALLLLSLFEYYYFGTGILHNFFGYRLIFIPAQLHSVFFDFFQINDFDFFQQGFMKFLFESSYDINYQFLIGDFWIGDSSARANNGLFSDAYANLGFFGIFILPFLLVVILKFINFPICNVSITVRTICVFYLTFVFLGMSLSNMVFSAGVIPFVFVSYMIKDKSEG